MKAKLKILLIILCLSVFLPVVADDTDMPATTDMWDNWNSSDNLRDAKAVSDKEFDNAIEQIDKKINKWKNWANKRKIPKGQEMSQSNESELINEGYGDKKVDPVILIPTELIVGNCIIPVGHYKVLGEKDNGKTFINLYQAHERIAQIPAIETSEDFDSEVISFANWSEYNNNYLKIEFGSLDFNAYAYVRIYNNTN